MRWVVLPWSTVAMRSSVEKPFLVTAAFWLAGLCAINSAIAGTPPGKMQIFGRPLDLRPPPHAIEPSEKRPLSFSSLRHAETPGTEAQPQLPSLGIDGMRSRNRIDEYVRRVHTEGLPVARLFESKSALVHLGLSPRGKPGLWLVQKTH